MPAALTQDALALALTLDAEICAGLDAAQIKKLMARLLFIKWLIATGRLNDNA